MSTRAGGSDAERIAALRAEVYGRRPPGAAVAELSALLAAAPAPPFESGWIETATSSSSDSRRRAPLLRAVGLALLSVLVAAAVADGGAPHLVTVDARAVRASPPVRTLFVIDVADASPTPASPLGPVGEGDQREPSSAPGLGIWVPVEQVRTVVLDAASGGVVRITTTPQSAVRSDPPGW